MSQSVVDAALLENMNNFLLDCLERYSHIEVSCFAGDAFFDVKDHLNFNPVRENSAYREQIISICQQKQEPTIFVDEFFVAYIAIHMENPKGPVYFFLGPASIRPMDKITLHRFYRTHGQKNGDEKQIPVRSLSKIILLAQMAAGLLTNKQYTEQELIKANHLNVITDQEHTSEEIHISMEMEEREAYHHSYQDERKLLECIRNGETEEALRLNLAMEDVAGDMSFDHLKQVRKLVVVAITLCTRAAIEGGLPPYEAYQISDYYMQKMDLCNTESELTACTNEAIRSLSERVRRRLEKQKSSSYIDSCVSYINQHYREHIYLDDLAEKTGITPTYLSRLFSQEMGMTFQEYVLKVRAERAANLLKYSEASIAQIGDYVNFPNQSYFGKIFKKYMGMTPKAYRNRYKLREFSDTEK